MTTAAWLVFVLSLVVLLMVIRRNEEVGERIDRWIESLLLIACGLIGLLVLVYGAVKFVRWAWYN